MFAMALTGSRDENRFPSRFIMPNMEQPAKSLSSLKGLLTLLKSFILALQAHFLPQTRGQRGKAKVFRDEILLELFHVNAVFHKMKYYPCSFDVVHKDHAHDHVVFEHQFFVKTLLRIMLD